MNVSDIQVSVLGGVVFHAGVMAHLFRVFFHIVHGVVGDDAFGPDRLIHVSGEVGRIVLVKFPCAAVAAGKKIFVSIAGFGEASGDAANVVL